MKKKKNCYRLSGMIVARISKLHLLTAIISSLVYGIRIYLFLLISLSSRERYLLSQLMGMRLLKHEVSFSVDWRL